MKYTGNNTCLCPGCGRMTISQNQIKNINMQFTESQHSQNISNMNQSGSYYLLLPRE